MESISIALVGDPIEQAGSRISVAEWTRKWDERDQIELEVTDDEALASIVERTFVGLSVPTSPQELPPYLSVDVALHEEGQERPRAWDWTLVDDAGRAIWTAYDLRLIPYGQLKRAVDAGAVTGDPKRLYLVFSGAEGNGGLIDWPTVMQAWQAVDQIIVRVGEYGGAVAATGALYRVIRDRVRKGRAAAEPQVPPLSQRGAWPDTVARFLDDRPWHPADLARLLGCTEKQAQDTIELFGFARSEEDGLWHRAADEAARRLALTFDELGALADLDLGGTGRELFDQRITHVLTTGTRPPEIGPDIIDDHQAWEEVERHGKIQRLAVGAGLTVAGFLAGILFRRDR